MQRPLRRLVAPLAAAALAAAIAAPAGAAPLPSRIDLPDGFQPEGITQGPGTWVIVGSLANGALWAGNVVSGASGILYPGAAGQVSVGIAYDPATDRIWVAGGPTGQVRVHDGQTGALLRTYTATAGFLNDVAVTKDAVYVTDSVLQQLVVIPLGPAGALPDAAETLPLTGELSYSAGFNANGIVAVRGWLVLVQSNEGLLFRVDPATGDTVEIDTGGYSVQFGDGLEARGSTLYVVRNQIETVAVLRLGAHLTTATLLHEITAPDDLDVPTTAALEAGRLWAVNARFGTPPTPDTEYWITRLPTHP